MKCPQCASSQPYPTEQTTVLGYRVYRCRRCQKRFNERTGTVFNHLQYPTDVVLLVVLWRLRYKLSLRDLAEMFLMRGFSFSHETARFCTALQEVRQFFRPSHSLTLSQRRQHFRQRCLDLVDQWQTA